MKTLTKTLCSPSLLFLAAGLLLAGCGPTSTGDDDDSSGDDDDDDDDGAANGWPESPDPGYTGDGHAVGDAAMNLTAQDQNGNDVDLHQFMGSMILLDFSALWCVPCNEAAATAQSCFEEIQAEAPYDFWYLHLLVDDETPGAPWADAGHATAWSSTYGLEFPVLAGDSVADYATAMGAEALPTFAVLDQNMVIREIWTGEPTCAELADRVGSHAGM